MEKLAYYTKWEKNILAILHIYVDGAILCKMGEIIVVILHIYVATAIFLLFYDGKDTESESLEI